jgi:hypothetical protein
MENICCPVIDMWESHRKHSLLNSFYCCNYGALISNGSYPIVAYVFVAAGMCCHPDNDTEPWILSRCLAMGARSDSDILAFRRHATLLSSRLRLDVTSGLYPSGVPTKILYVFLFSLHVCYIPCQSHPPWLYHSIYVCEEYNLWISSLWSLSFL